MNEPTPEGLRTALTTHLSRAVAALAPLTEDRPNEFWTLEGNRGLPTPAGHVLLTDAEDAILHAWTAARDYEVGNAGETVAWAFPALQASLSAYLTVHAVRLDPQAPVWTLSAVNDARHTLRSTLASLN